MKSMLCLKGFGIAGVVIILACGLWKVSEKQYISNSAEAIKSFENRKSAGGGIADHRPAGTSAENSSQNSSLMATRKEIKALKNKVKELDLEKKEFQTLAMKLQKEINSFRADLRQMGTGQKDIVESLNAMNDVYNRNTNNQPQNPDSVDGEIDRRPNTPAEDLEEVEAFVEEQVLTLDNRLYGEYDDPEWTKEAEDSIWTVFENETETGFQLTGTECKSTLCKVEFNFETDELSQENFHKVLGQIPWKGEFFLKTEKPEGELSRVQFYLARAGYSLQDLVD